MYRERLVPQPRSYDMNGSLTETFHYGTTRLTCSEILPNMLPYGSTYSTHTDTFLLMPRGWRYVHPVSWSLQTAG